MQTINSPDGLFHDGNPATGELGTILSSAWLNAVQNELITAISTAGLTPDANKQNQLADAIKKLAWGSTSARPSTLAGYGIALASQADAYAGSDNSVAMTPLRSREALRAGSGISATLTASANLDVTTMGLVLVNTSAAATLTFNTSGVPAGARFLLKRIDAGSHDVQLKPPAGKNFAGVCGGLANIGLLYLDDTMEFVFDGNTLVLIDDQPGHDYAYYAARPGYVATPPRGVVLASGQALSAATTPILFALYGATAPDPRGYFERYTDEGAERDPGGNRTVRGVQQDNLGSHLHGLPTDDGMSNTGSTVARFKDVPAATIYGYGSSGDQENNNNLVIMPDNGIRPLVTQKTGGTETVPINIAVKPFLRRG
ncbi:hypothetical protein OL229_21620 [Neisseriaceae bacterium JH1-16]|nr:hypothetical protein [Neisseriaceae bacterium JH1-16]